MSEIKDWTGFIPFSLIVYILNIWCIGAPSNAIWGVWDDAPQLYCIYLIYIYNNLMVTICYFNHLICMQSLIHDHWLSGFEKTCGEPHVG